MRTRLMIALFAAITMIMATVGLTAGVASAELVDPTYPSGSSGINGPDTKGITDGLLMPAPGGEEDFTSPIQIGGSVSFTANYGTNATSLELRMGSVVLATTALNGPTVVNAQFGNGACALVGTTQSVVASVTDAAGAVLYVDVLNFSPAVVSDPTNQCGGNPPPPPVQPPVPPQPPAPAVPAAHAPVAVATGPASTGHIVTADNGFSSLVNGDTTGKVADQATEITPKQGQAAHAAAAKELAYTGNESFYLIYAGLGLVAAGAVAMGSRRRLHTVTED